jgi:uncharacterized cupredoxin-like copper-binding protein
VKALSALLVGVALVGVGCSSSESGAGGLTEVVGTDTTCKPAKTEFAAGKQTFEIENKGSKATELYVYGKDDKIISEVENVGPGTSRELTVDLKAGDYELACKPGQTGNGIRVPIKVTGAGGSESAEKATKYDREAEVVGTEYKFTGLEGFSGKTGEAIEFKLENKGTLQHEFELLGPDGKALGEIEPIDAGKTGEVVFTLKDPGTYTYVCGIEDSTGNHEAMGMKGTFTVS